MGNNFTNQSAKVTKYKGEISKIYFRKNDAKREYNIISGISKYGKSNNRQSYYNKNSRYDGSNGTYVDKFDSSYTPVSYDLIMTVSISWTYNNEVHNKKISHTIFQSLYDEQIRELFKHKSSRDRAIEALSSLIGKEVQCISIKQKGSKHADWEIVNMCDIIKCIMQLIDDYFFNNDDKKEFDYNDNNDINS